MATRAWAAMGVVVCLASDARAAGVGAVDLGAGVISASTPDFEFGDLSGRAGSWHAGYRFRRYGDVDTRIPNSEVEFLFAGGFLPSARFAGAPGEATPDDAPYFHLRLAAGARWSVGRVRLGGLLLRPHVGLGMQLPVHLFEVSVASEVPGAGVWNLGAYGDTYGPSLGARAEAGGWLFDGRFDLMFGPLLGAALAPGSFGDLGGTDVEGGTDNLKHTARYTRFEVRVERTRGISPFLVLSLDRYRMKLRGSPPGVADPLRVGGPSALVGVTLRKKLAAVDAGRAAPAGADGGDLLEAIRGGRTERALALLAAGAPVDAELPLDGTALGLAAAAGDLEVVDALIRAGADVNRGASGNGLTPLMLAAANGATAAVERLLAVGATVDARDTNGELTALMHACRASHADAVDRLLAAGADRAARSAVDGAGNGGHDCAAWNDRGFGSEEAKAAVRARLAVP